MVNSCISSRAKFSFGSFSIPLELQITPPGGGEPIAYTRVSTMAKALDDLNNLMAWKNRKVIEGVLRRPDLRDVADGEVVGDERKRSADQFCLCEHEWQVPLSVLVATW